MYQKKLCAVMTTLSTDLQESAIRQYLTLTAVLTNRYKMKQLLTLLENLVNTNILQARSALSFLPIFLLIYVFVLFIFKGFFDFRMLCDCILASDKLVYENADYWIECFNLIRRIIGGVDYKGVREIMKVGWFDHEHPLIIWVYFVYVLYACTVFSSIYFYYLYVTHFPWLVGKGDHVYTSTKK